MIPKKEYTLQLWEYSERKGTYDLIQVGAKLKGKIDSKYKFVLAGDGEIEKPSKNQ